MNCKERLYVLGVSLLGFLVFSCSIDGFAVGRCFCFVF